jgi:20S proteasome alpha/beta subunit
VTLLVGVLCSNGAVIAADQQATHGAMGQYTVGQAVTKVRVINGETLYASSGHHGLGQQLCSVVEGQRQQFKNHPYVTCISELQEKLRPFVNNALTTAGLAARLVGNTAAMSDAWCSGLLAAGFKDGLKLVEITPQVAVEYMTKDLPFISMGSGKPSADPFLGFLRKVYWPTTLPTIQEGALAAYWTIQHAIDMKVFGVGFSVDVFVVEPSDETFKARKLDDAEIAEHVDFMKSSEEAMRSVREALTVSPATQTPSAEPPTLNQKG